MGSSCASYRVGNFELKWTDFVDNLASSFIDLRDEGDLLDVTLVCDDDQLEAHKVILSAGSVFFKSVIKRNPRAHPLIYLKGVKIEDMKALIDFMYLGQTKVCQEDVQAFLVLGEELGVKGLARNKRIANIGKVTKDEISTTSLEFEEDDAKKSKETNVEIKMEDHLSIDMNTDATNTNDNIMNVVLEENVDNQLDTTVASDMEEQCADVSIDADLDAQVENYITKATNAEGLTGYQCTTCYKFSLKKQNIRKHAEIHIEGLSFPCNLCERTFKTRNTYRTHTYIKHKVSSK